MIDILIKNFEITGPIQRTNGGGPIVVQVLTTFVVQNREYKVPGFSFSMDDKKDAVNKALFEALESSELVLRDIIERNSQKKDGTAILKELIRNGIDKSAQELKDVKVAELVEQGKNLQDIEDIFNSECRERQITDLNQIYEILGWGTFDPSGYTYLTAQTLLLELNKLLKKFEKVDEGR